MRASDGSGQGDGRSGCFIAAGVVIGLFVLLAGGGVWWGWTMFTDQAREALDRNPVIREHLGPVQEIDFDLMRTGHTKKDDEFVFRVRGTKGEGVVRAVFVTEDADTETIRSGTLELPSGARHDLLDRQ